MRDWQRQSHVKWYCRYHVVIVAYSTEFCHPVQRKAATQSMRSLPPSPWQSCHSIHGKAAA
jgi:hypothetical protein